MESLKLVIVMPCFNEEHTLEHSCASLGFGTGFDSTPVDTVLVLVDNNSTDNTVALAERIASNSLVGTVIIGHETVQGYVPPRHHGSILARELAQSRQWPLENVLLLQADADTHYTVGYGESMRTIALAKGPNHLFEASVAHWSSFQMAYPSYVALCNETDNQFARLFPRKLSDEVIVDDKIAGYRLSDYFHWGGHQQEFTHDGEEIHAETTRLYIRARAMGALKVGVTQALALHSARKIIAEPMLHLATAGFPRESSWNRYFHSNIIECKLEQMEKMELGDKTSFALRSRALHLLGLLSILPIHINRTLNYILDDNLYDFSTFCLSRLPRRTIADMLHHPSLFLMDIFTLLRTEGEVLLAQAEDYIGK